MLTGENGILTQAQNAQSKTEEAEEKERIQLAITEAQLGDGGYQDLTEENLQKEIDEEFGSGEVRVYPNEKNAFSFIFQNKEANYRLEKDGTLNKIDIALKIYDINDFEDFVDKVNAGNTFENQYVYLMENMDLKNQEWNVIGSYTDDSNNQPFAGIFEGNNKKISGINLIKNQDNTGLFAYNTGIIRDVILESGSIIGNRRVGGITAINAGIIENCGNLTDIVSETSGYVGGICGTNRGKIISSYNKGNIKAVFNAGGISGGNNEDAILEYCYNLGDVEGTGEEDETNITHSGGISGHTYGKINSCYNMGNIKSEYSDGGGIVGTILINAEVSNCYNLGEIYNNGNNIGNIVGAAYHQTKIINCYFSKEICELNGVGGVAASTVTVEVIEKNSSYMKTSSFVNDLNKDKKVFTISSGLNDGYPVLKWQVE